MDFKDLLLHRRSIRDFQDREVPLAVVQEILQDTCMAPTASNGQPCRFIIIRDRRVMKRLSDESKRNLLADLTGDPSAPMKAYEATLKNDAFNVFYNAPCLIYIIGSGKVHSLEVDCALTAAYLMFSAASRGLGTCWIGLGAHIRSRELLREIGVSEGFQIAAPIILGYPMTVPQATERHAPDIARVI